MENTINWYGKAVIETVITYIAKNYEKNLCIDDVHGTCFV